MANNIFFYLNIFTKPHINIYINPYFLWRSSCLLDQHSILHSLLYEPMFSMKILVIIGSTFNTPFSPVCALSLNSSSLNFFLYVFSHFSLFASIYEDAYTMFSEYIYIYIYWHVNGPHVSHKVDVTKSIAIAQFTGTTGFIKKFSKD